jgi:hypothetical protein
MELDVELQIALTHLAKEMTKLIKLVTVQLEDPANRFDTRSDPPDRHVKSVYRRP